MFNEIYAWMIGCLAAVAIVSGLFATREHGREDGVAQMQREAVIRGHASYAVDESGDPVWKWNDDIGVTQ